jgi:hypothetical protein
MTDIIIQEGPNEGGRVNIEGPVRPFPVGQRFLNWYQGDKPEWMMDKYAEYVNVDGDFAYVQKGAHRNKVDLLTRQTNEHRSHDWKGYDEIYPVTATYIYINDIAVGEVSTGGDLLHHLVAVNSRVNKILGSLPIGWFTQENIDSLVGREVAYKGHRGTIKYFILDQFCAIVHIPGFSKDNEYWDDDDIKIEIDYIDWYPS